VRAYPDLIRAWVPRRYFVLGTDGFGRSDTRVALRDFFEIDKRYITLAALRCLGEDGQISGETLIRAIEHLGIDPGKPNPQGQ
jgi:pyruvate dehydrogenase E1 component